MPPLTPWEQRRGARFGALLRQTHGDRSMVEVPAAAEVPAETLRKIETGRAPTPAFFTVAALTAALEVPLNEPGHCVLAGRRPRQPGAFSAVLNVGPDSQVRRRRCRRGPRTSASSLWRSTRSHSKVARYPRIAALIQRLPAMPGGPAVS